MKYPIKIDEKVLDSITVQNLKLHRDGLCELVQELQYNEKILDAYQQSLLMGHQEALYGIEYVLKYFENYRLIKDE